MHDVGYDMHVTLFASSPTLITERVTEITYVFIT